MPLILPFNGKHPRIAPSAYIAPNATLIGDVEIGEEASVWFGCVLRADVGSIRLGARSNIQDNSCVHLTEGMSSTTVGEEVTVGHGVILHGCTVGDRALIGMGSILLDLSEVGAGSVLGAGSLLTPRTVIPPGQLAHGRPARVQRPVNATEARLGIGGARHYIEVSRRYLAGGLPGAPLVAPVSLFVRTGDSAVSPARLSRLFPREPPS